MATWNVQVNDLATLVQLNAEASARATGDTTNAQNLSDHEGRTDNPHNVTKTQVGLGNVDNTSDADSRFRTGNTLWVDAVYGVDVDGVRERQNKPFLTLGAAVVAAQPGDTIRVRPGAYTATSAISKDAVNWYFEPGSTVTMSTGASASLFDDTAEAQTFMVGGHGRFLRTLPGTGAGWANVVHMERAGSTMAFNMDWFDATGIDAGAAAGSCATVYHKAGHLAVTGRYIHGFREAYYWIQGPAYLSLVESMISTGLHGVYCKPPEDNTDEVYIRCPHIEGLEAGVYSISDTATAPGFRLWVVSETIGGGGYAIEHGAGKVYIIAEKIYGADPDAVLVSSVSLLDGGDQLYINTQKFGLSDSLTEIGDKFRVTQITNNNKVRIVASELDLSNVTTYAGGGTAPLFEFGGDKVDFVLEGMRGDIPDVITCPMILHAAAVSGRREFINVRLKNSTGTPVTLTDNLTVLRGCDIVTGAALSIAAGAAHTVRCPGTETNVGVDANTTAYGLTVAPYVN